MSLSPSSALRPQLSLCIFLRSESLAQSVLKEVGHDRYIVHALKQLDDLFQFIEQEKQQLDCLILQNDRDLPIIANWLHGQATLLPAVIFDGEADRVDSSLPQSALEQGKETQASPFTEPGFIYHTAEVRISAAELNQIDGHIERAIAQFLNLSPACRIDTALSVDDVTQDLTAQNFLMLQQRRLTDKLKERLGYLGVYYKRNPQYFFRHLPPEQKQEFLEQLKNDYREIVLRYFTDDGTLNERIDAFVNSAFFADISVSQIVESHMELMDEFAKQLKLEGRSEEILLDYRLTLIDTIAHLCEMYRRSIPRES